ncbi:MAG: phosphocholine cytidylyltransferase family protein [Deltaproteobacteria bacterium]|nr:MAG: phosphocholine cytidylyltransferase family protein [Deltaproteobacteria bacterium]
MKPIIIGAGRGKRLEHLTDQIPKTMVPILGRPMLESILTALAAGGFERSDTVYICGYKGEVIRAAYPELSYVENEDWANNNILLSLMCARQHLLEGFVSSYADIVYRSEAIARLMDSPHDITLVCDTDWRRRYQDRSQHPENDAEKLRAEGDRIIELSRHIPADQASGEFIGVMRLTAAGAARFVDAFDQAAEVYSNQPVFRDGRSFQKAYLIDLLQHMIESGESLHCLSMHGGYMEIDTTEDAACADSWWQG